MADSKPLRPTTFPRDTVRLVERGTFAHSGFGVAVRPAILGGNRDVLIVARTAKELRRVFPLLSGGAEVDERGIKPVAILDGTHVQFLDEEL